MIRNLLCLASAGVALTLFAGCNAASTPTASGGGRTRILKSQNDISGRPNFVKTDVNANALVTCADVHGDTVCYVRTPGVLPVSLKKGETTTAATAGTLVLSCNGGGPQFCEITIKD
jgi:hypothetical protein